MGFTDRIKGFFAQKDERDAEEGSGLGVNDKGETIYKETLIAEINEKLNRAKQERHPYELQWQLNANFLAGNQFVDINPYSNRIEEYSRPYEYLEHEVYNQIAPLIETRVANLQKIGFLMTVRPATSELSDYQKANVATNLLRYVQTSTDFKSKMDTAITWAETQGTVFILNWWNKRGGEVVGEIDVAEFDENGETVIGKETVHEGAINYGLVSSHEVYPESCMKENISDQQYVILEQAMTVSEVYDRYGVKLSGAEVNTFAISPKASSGGFGYEATVMSLETNTVSDAVLLVTYFEKPSRSYPKGRLAIYAGDELIHYGELPYDEIPLVAIKSKIVPGQFFGKSVIQDLIPLQRTYNSAKNSILDYMHTISIGGYIAEEGAIDVDDYAENGSEPGSILTYREGSPAPVPKPNAPLPGTVLDVAMSLRTEMEYIAGVSQLMVSGTGPSGVTSGTAISQLQEIDNTRLSLTGNNIRNAVIALSKLWLRILRKNASGYRVCKTVGANDAGDVLVWCREDINSEDVVYNTENELIVSPAAQKQAFLEAYNMGLLTNDGGVVPQRVKRKAVEALKINDFSEISTIDELQAKYAQRENSFAREGILPEIHSFDDHNIHLEEHMRFVLQADFALYRKKSEYNADKFLEHIEQHKAAISQAQMQAMQNMQSMQNNAQ